METKILEHLADISDNDFIVLQKSLEMANWTRSMMKRFDVSLEEMASAMEIDINQMILFKNGCFDYSVRDMGKLQSMQMKYEIEAAKKRVDSQIQFPDYEYSKTYKKQE